MSHAGAIFSLALFAIAALLNLVVAHKYYRLYKRFRSRAAAWSILIIIVLSQEFLATSIAFMWSSMLPEQLKVVIFFIAFASGFQCFILCDCYLEARDRYAKLMQTTNEEQSQAQDPFEPPHKPEDIIKEAERIIRKKPGKH